ncbi:hypothetical protein ABZ953_06945 [Streptomyces sp. NPDC046465]|uniref:hypothetical protein n=1 Tax=Streptomyces sp. NPDC046465 TaxID=3155810 RepID=UPI0033DDCEA7
MAASTFTPVHSNHHGNGGDVPWQIIVGYIAVGLIGWLVTAVLVIRHEQAKSGKPADVDDKIMAVAMGLVTCVGWPLVIVGYGVWKAIEAFTRQPVNMTKRDR